MAIFAVEYRTFSALSGTARKGYAVLDGRGRERSWHRTRAAAVKKAMQLSRASERRSNPSRRQRARSAAKHAHTLYGRLDQERIRELRELARTGRGWRSTPEQARRILGRDKRAERARAGRNPSGERPSYAELRAALLGNSRKVARSAKAGRLSRRMTIAEQRSWAAKMIRGNRAFLRGARRSNPRRSTPKRNRLGQFVKRGR